MRDTSSTDRASDPKLTEVIEAGRDLGVEVAPQTFDKETRTAEDAAREVGCEVGQIVKSLVFASAGGPVLLLVSGANRVDLGKGAAALGVEALDRADATAAKAATGFSIGATPPFGHATPLPVAIDEDLLGYDVVWAAAGRNDSVFAVEPKLLADATDARVANLRAE